MNSKLLKNAAVAEDDAEAAEAAESAGVARSLIIPLSLSRPARQPPLASADIQDDGGDAAAAQGELLPRHGRILASRKVCRRLPPPFRTL